MRYERLTLSLPGDAALLAAQLRALVPAPASVQDAVADIIARVREGGDAAVLECTRRFDTGGREPRALRVPEAQLEAAARRLSPAVRDGLQSAIDNVAAVASAARERGAPRMVKFARHQVLLREAPVSSAGVYVPGGRAPYPSTVVMGVVSARAAGVRQVAVCAPPGSDGELDAAILGACGLTGASAVYRMGGAQAVAAMAYGTESVQAVRVIVGPGSLYVQEAKRQVLGQVGIDGFAGPSDLVAIADRVADPDVLALDLLAQTEHGPGSLVIAISSSPALLRELGPPLQRAHDTGAVVRLIEVADLDQALALAQALAPEHLQLLGPQAEQLAARVDSAGCVFVGAGAGTAFGDYIAGSNHILPTGGAARFASGLSPLNFLRSFAEVRIDDASELARAAAPVARAEGFELHARSMEARIRDNGTG